MWLIVWVWFTYICLDVMTNQLSSSLQHISDPDLYGLIKKFVDVNKGGHIPYGGSIDSRREDDPENPLYDYVMEEGTYVCL